MNTLLDINKNGHGWINSLDPDKYDRILKIAINIADFTGKDDAQTEPQIVAIQYRNINRKNEVVYQSLFPLFPFRLMSLSLKK